eukprot:6214476-Pleurochrysis_carterae.AAC.6
MGISSSDGRAECSLDDDEILNRESDDGGAPQPDGALELSQDRVFGQLVRVVVAARLLAFLLLAPLLRRHRGLRLLLGHLSRSLNLQPGQTAALATEYGNHAHVEVGQFPFSPLEAFDIKPCMKLVGNRCRFVYEGGRAITIHLCITGMNKAAAHRGRPRRTLRARRTSLASAWSQSRCTEPEQS